MVLNKMSVQEKTRSQSELTVARQRVCLQTTEVSYLKETQRPLLSCD